MHCEVYCNAAFRHRLRMLTGFRFAWTDLFEQSSPDVVEVVRISASITRQHGDGKSSQCNVTICSRRALVRELTLATESSALAAAKRTCLLYARMADSEVQKLHIHVKQISRSVDEFVRDCCVLDAEAVFENGACRCTRIVATAELG